MKKGKFVNDPQITKDTVFFYRGYHYGIVDVAIVQHHDPDKTREIWALLESYSQGEDDMIVAKIPMSKRRLWVSRENGETIRHGNSQTKALLLWDENTVFQTYNSLSVTLVDEYDSELEIDDFAFLTDDEINATDENNYERFCEAISKIRGATVYDTPNDDSYVELTIATNEFVDCSKQIIQQYGYTVIDECESEGSDYTAYYIWFNKKNKKEE